MSDRYGLTRSGKPRTRPLRTADILDRPPALSREEAPGYLYLERAKIWVYAEDFSVVIEVARETNNPEIASRHGTRATKNQGCTGPLCRKALRDDLYGGARSLRLKRLEELLDALQSSHNDEWAGNLSDEAREKLASSLERYRARVDETLALVKSA